VVGGSLFKFSERQVAEKLEAEKLHGMSTALATVAHEMRTPLISVSASARGLQRYVAMLIRFYEKHQDIVGAEDKIPADRLAMTVPTINRIQGEAKYMNSIIDLLLANATGRSQPQNLAVFQIDAAVQQTLELYPFENAKQRALVEVACESSFAVMGIEDLFRTVLTNLIKNSLKAIDRARKGTLVIKLTQTENGGRMIVRDTGCGIPRNQLPFVFKRFYSYPSAEGTGIGLAFCRDTLASWGAHISCRSEEGVYTEVEIQFPPAVIAPSGGV
jgi:two-component system CAI-1 autoinducer sensor kinase/phosphatase CqsS